VCSGLISADLPHTNKLSLESARRSETNALVEDDCQASAVVAKPNLRSLAAAREPTVCGTPAGRRTSCLAADRVRDDNAFSVVRKPHIRAADRVPESGPDFLPPERLPPRWSVCADQSHHRPASLARRAAPLAVPHAKADEPEMKRTRLPGRACASFDRSIGSTTAIVG
jgi:hypothetical protein